MDNLPEQGEWLLANPVFGDNPPFAVLKIDFIRRSGTCRYLQQTTTLNTITRIAPDKFGARYQIGGKKGLFDAVYRDDKKLDLKFTSPTNLRSSFLSPYIATTRNWTSSSSGMCKPHAWRRW
jgi:hypothetical protein